MNIPDTLKYTPDHEWISVDGLVATIGITEFAQQELGDIVFIDVATIGETLDKGEPFGTIEAVKTVSDLFMPVSGAVIEFNSLLKDKAYLVNKDPYNQGWIIKVNIADASELDQLLTHTQYKELIG